MGNWKELGVVPDSDDEGFDSEDSLPPPLRHSPPKSPLEKRHDDIWEFPGSSGSFNGHRETTPAIEQTPDKHNEPRSTASADLGQDTRQPCWKQQDAPSSDREIRGDEADRTNRSKGSQNTPTTILPERDEISSSIVQINAHSANPFPGSSLEPGPELRHLREYHENGHDPRPSSQLQATRVQRDVPVESYPPAGRSLRPRKPIQEHPYRLENAQYSRFMKSHGVKPIHIAVQEQNLSKGDDGKVSQEQDYTSNESQPTSGGPGEESQGIRTSTLRYALDDDVDELALSPSPRTSSPRRQLQASSERSRSQQTDDTSINGEEEFPDIKHLATKPARTPARPSKRPTPSRPSTLNKRLKSRHEILRHAPPPVIVNDDWDIPPSPDPLRVDPTLADSPSPNGSPRPLSQLTEDPFVMTPLERLNADSELGINREIVDLSNDLDGSADEGPSDQEDRSSDVDSEIVQRNVKRIRGVLPASWLRLDQQTSKSVRKGVIRRPTPPRSPDGRQRGVATVRRTKANPASNFLDDLGDDDDEDDAPRQTNDLLDLDAEYGASFPNNGPEGIDDNLSVIEEDYVDWMLPGGKRNRTSRGLSNKRKKNAQQKLFKGEKRYRQPQISKSLHRVDRSSSSGVRSRHSKTNVKQSTSKTRAASPPALGIVDVVEPGAPRFVRIAARAASRRHDLGRSKPNNRAINLGTRKDNVDVHSVIRDWQAGNIKQKAVQRRPASGNLQTGLELRKSRRPLGQLSPNITRHSGGRSGISFTQPSKMAKQVIIDDFVITSEAATQFRPGDDSIRRTALRKTPSHNVGGGHLSRPAQLESEVSHGTDNAAFTARKKMLDLVFRKSRKEILAPTFLLQKSSPNKAQLEKNPVEVNCSEQSVLGHEEPKDQRPKDVRRHFRKQIAPKRLDLDAPQFRHANDPLPAHGPLVNEESFEALHQGQNKILGLGPYGTQYTHNFEIFPLQEGVYFHHSTLIGNGTLRKAVGCQDFGDLSQPRPVTSFNLADHYFHWGHWTETTSSELGLLFDLLSEQLSTINESDVEPRGCQAISCADHVLQYLMHSVSVKDGSDLRSCVQRLSELLLSFFELTQSFSTESQPRVFLEIYVRFLICALVVLRICQSGAELSSAALQAEELIKQYSRLIVKRLLEIGTSGVRATYDDLQRLSAREQGIRSDNFTMICWVIVIQVLNSAHIPRAGFWDVTYSMMVSFDLHQSSDAQQFEKLWRDIFTLVPLEDFDDTGIVNKSLRHTTLIQGSHGWGLPQKLLKRVFESSQSNPKQSPSFNEYCRALLGRCHYLIDQWGWYKCSGIVGTIFDFFGRQNLSNLRNEEVYKSPRFLDNLGGMASLSVEAEDRCFHIFLKMLGLAIQKMRRRGLFNDIRNLIARTLPNHDRQYSKEQTIHAHDLAALRNHHDLLCTLFWAAPPEERPAVHLIEKLVSPGSSHKEAVLVNLRAWKQLATFVVSSGAAVDIYRPFMPWQNHVFQQVLDQYLSAAADIQRQFMSMPTETRKDIGQQMLDSFVSANQTAAKDVLYFSVTASLEVMAHCPSLVSAMFSFNTSQLNKALTSACTDGKDLDFGILRASFETVELFLERLEKLGDVLKEESNDSLSSSDNHEYNDAVEFLDEKVVQGLFIAVRQVLASSAPDKKSHHASVSALREKALTLSGRIASLFVNGGKRSLKHFFSIGKYGLFETTPQNLSLKERTSLPLFVAILLKNHVFDFSSVGCSHFDIWLLSLVKPSHALKYEVHLAETLRTLNLGYMECSAVFSGARPDYCTNRDYFACAISYMRKELRLGDSGRRKSLRAKYEKLLKLVMQQMKSDITSLNLDSEEHQGYMIFIRQIVALIKSHGAEICPVDPFYFQASAEYSPAAEDPQLHSAGIISYGLRLGEGETTAGAQLFYYLYNHFKLSMASSRLDDESKIIEKGMNNDNILGFSLSRMLPVVIWASLTSPDIWPLLGVYTRALRDLLGRPYLSREIPRKCLEHSVALLETILGYLESLKEKSTHETEMSPPQVQLFVQLMEICHAMRPTLSCWLLQPSTEPTKRLQGCVNRITRVSRQATAYLDEVCSLQGREMPLQRIVVEQLLAGLDNTSMSSSVFSGADGQMATFSQHLQHEVQNSWIVTEATITAKVALTSSAQPGTQPAQGVRNNLGTRAGGLLLDLNDQLRKWIEEMGAGEGNGRGLRGRRPRRRGRAGSRQTEQC
ncbi:hypothetical protein N8I77_006469 [Diaporthe amygdali]|uniref:Mus7/MMS22 family-domain-containing protein n=1 Tax=Phomopsis amygdali TaxID=1214568 RepID=A0AAD9SHU3_PHOAM|nr:hypothetical protein N8I77_006469 [Diaporthe amygdali]